jgi:hypothetical protein
MNNHRHKRGRTRMEIVGSIIIQNMPHPYSHAKRGEVFKFSKARGNGHGFPLSNSLNILISILHSILFWLQDK